MRHIETNAERANRQPFVGEVPDRSMVDLLHASCMRMNIAHTKLKGMIVRNPNTEFIKAQKVTVTPV